MLLPTAFIGLVVLLIVAAGWLLVYFDMRKMHGSNGAVEPKSNDINYFTDSASLPHAGAETPEDTDPSKWKGQELEGDHNPRRRTNKETES